MIRIKCWGELIWFVLSKVFWYYYRFIRIVRGLQLMQVFRVCCKKLFYFSIKIRCFIKVFFFFRIIQSRCIKFYINVWLLSYFIRKRRELLILGKCFVFVYILILDLFLVLCQDGLYFSYIYKFFEEVGDYRGLDFVKIIKGRNSLKKKVEGCRKGVSGCYSFLEVRVGVGSYFVFVFQVYGRKAFQLRNLYFRGIIVG